MTAAEPGSGDAAEARLAALFPGDLAWCAARVRPREVLPEAEPLPSFFADGAFERAIATFAAVYPQADRRSVVSMWSMYYFSCLTLPCLAAALGSGHRLPVDLEETSLALGEHGLPTAFGLARDAAPIADGDGDARFAPLFARHLRPVVDVMARKGGISAKLAWCNVAAYVDYGVHLACARPNLPERERRCALALVGDKTAPDGLPNPLFGAIRRVEENGETVRRRKVCCLRYMLPGIEGCGSLCALPSVRQQAAA
ncbi:siderophore-iron reductase FhuF [Marinivivus vitaminiproducens]|uniref:siderophore-iron reductase FhuF n=1 Tax=Marinivivus vitaminiproducens TaxID=3035935 RepID=UPI0027A4408A|nr:siderophore-iron reductase FhuF [Geminicoccaceae bacterium SCSIO 64248]